jgi:hypothetical protein
MLFPENFGRMEDPDWILARDLSRALKLAWAREQHELALQVQLLCLAHRNSIPDVADALEQRRETLWNKLTGRWPANEEDLQLWAWLTNESRRNFKPEHLADEGVRIRLPKFPLIRRRDQ